MTARLDDCFSTLRAAGRKALVAYLCVGDPSLEESVELCVAAARAGADLLELGVPFSDPTADGPAIARASQRAIRGGATILRVLEVAAEVGRTAHVPMVLFGYYNPILVTGEARVVPLAAGAGIDAMLVVDLPPEEGETLRTAAAGAGVAMIPLVTPTTDAARLDAISAARPSGFMYYVSVTGVTGVAAPALARASTEAARLRARMRLPVVVGFGIDGPAAAREAAGPRGGGADGIVVGTAIVRRIEEASSPAARVLAVRSLVSDLRAALDGS